MTFTTRITAPTAYRGDLQLNGSGKPIALTRITTGLTGKPGSALVGGSGDLYFTYDQPSASAEWTVAHNLGKYPSVSVVDSAGDLVEGAVTYLDANSVRIVFSAAFSGRAFFN